MVSPQKIKYNNIFSDTGLGALDIIFDVAFDSDNGAMSSYLNRSAVASESHDGRYKNTIRYKFDELFSPQFTIVKKDFSDFSQEEIRQVLKYLTSTDKPALLEVYYDGASNVVDWACIGGWTSIETYKIANSRTVGFVAQFEAITPYAMSDIYTVTKTISSATDNKITINIDTDDNKSVYPRITINHGYGATPTPHLVVKLPNTVSFDNITDMADYVENTVYHNESTNTYYYKAYTPTFTSSSTLPEYVNWTTVEVERPYTSADTFATNTFYHYDYEGKYYWKVGDTFYAEPSSPVYGDWKTKVGTKVYTANDTFEEKTIYSYNNKYYWMAPHNFYKSSTPPNLQTTSVKITNQHYDFFGQPSAPVITVVKNNASTEKIVLDGANKIASTDRTRRIFGDDFNWQWLELYDGKNEITIEGNCEITLEYREVRKVGEY
jgi:hypothetical protein